MDATTETVRHGGLIALLERTLEGLAQRGSAADLTGDGRPDTTLGALIEALDERAFGVLLLLLAIPCCIPLLWGIPQVVALPMMAVVFQIAQGRDQPWLPARLRARSFDVAGMQSVLARVARYIGWAERLARPRLGGVTRGPGLRLVGALLLVPVISILSPIPMSNTAPGIGVAIAAVGLLERDGLLTLLGLLFGFAWAVALAALLAIFGFEGVQLAKDWIKAAMASGDLISLGAWTLGLSLLAVLLLIGRSRLRSARRR